MAYGDWVADIDTLSRINVGRYASWCRANGDYWLLVYQPAADTTKIQIERT